MNYALAAFFFILQLANVLSERTKRLKLQVIQHQPCSKIEGNLIEFPSSRTSQVKPDYKRGDGWYQLTGPVIVHKVFSGPLFIYLEMKNGSSAQPMPCEKSKDGCGGFGSCVYCDVCKSPNEKLHEKVGGQVEITANGEKFDCNKKIVVKKYDNVTAAIQAPETDSFLKSSGIDPQAWDDLIGAKGTTIFMSMYLINKDISHTPNGVLRTQAYKYEDVVGCHRMVVNISS